MADLDWLGVLAITYHINIWAIEGSDIPFASLSRVNPTCLGHVRWWFCTTCCAVLHRYSTYSTTGCVYCMCRGTVYTASCTSVPWASVTLMLQDGYFLAWDCGQHLHSDTKERVSRQTYCPTVILQDVLRTHRLSSILLWAGQSKLHSHIILALLVAELRCNVEKLSKV